MEEEKIYDCFITDEFSDKLIGNYLNNGNVILEKDIKLVTDLIAFSYITSNEIKIIELNMIHDVDDAFNSFNYLDKDEFNVLNKKFVLFLNKPDINGGLVIKNTKYGKNNIECVRNRLVIFPESYGFCVVPSIKNNYIIYGNINFETKIN